MAEKIDGLRDLAARVFVLVPENTEALRALALELGGATEDDQLDASVLRIVQEAFEHLEAAIELSGDARAEQIDAATHVLAALSMQSAAHTETPVTPKAAPVATTSDEADDFLIKITLPPAAANAAPSEPEPLNPELVSEFLVETRQYLADAEAGLLELETRPDDKEAIDRVFRAFHTIKGIAGFLAFDGIQAFAHAAEGLLSKMRNGQIRCVGHNATLALKSIDALRLCLVHVEEAAANNTPLVLPTSLDALVVALGAPDMRAEMNQPEIQFAPDIEVAKEAAPRAEKKEDAVWMRVRTDRLDRLIDMVGELVIAQSMVSQDPVLGQPAHEEFRKKVAHGAKIVRELQDLSMALRMVPLKSTFQRLTRVVRDIVQRTSKEVKFETDGEETEIDRNMVEVISDPLVHMVRNAIDHGIESREGRATNGKPAVGTVKLSAFHAGGHLVLRLSDDGKGMDRAVIVKKALERGLIRTDAGMTDEEVLSLIFAPGFSTKDVVTDISGRGVGMDVVKRGVDALKGRIETRSELGKGTTFTIHVPLTLAITDGMLVRVGDERFILPTVAIRTSFRPSAEMLSKVGGRGEFVRVRDEYVSVFRLHHIFGIAGAEQDPTKALVVVVDYGEGRSAFLVDELLAQQQVVSKGLSSSLLAVPGVAGGAILGDGRVGLILDPPGLVALAHQTNGWVLAA